MKRLCTCLHLCVGLGFVGVGTAIADDVRIGMLEIEGTLADRPDPLGWLLGPDAPPTLRDIVDALQATARDPDLDKLVIRLKDAALTQAQVEELAPAIDDVQRRGKTVHLFCESYGPAEFLLGACCDESIIQSGGWVSLPGIHIEEMYFGDVLQWLGVKADLLQVGDHKGANEAMTRSGPSEAWSVNLNQLVDGLYENRCAAICKGRGLSRAALDGAMGEAWMASGARAIELGLLDAQVDLAVLAEHLARGSTPVWEDVVAGDPSGGLDFSSPFAIFSAIMSSPDHSPTRDTIAILHIDGPIVDGDSTDDGLFGGGSVGSRTIRNALEEVLADDHYKGVIVRIDSPGGSATASEIIWQGLRRVAQKKPVWASVGGMAASGGYYIAVGADRIYVSPSSIVGSIGVVGGKFSMSGLYDLARIRVHTTSRGPHADLFASNEPWSDAQARMVRAKLQQTFDLFSSRVSTGRPGIDLSKTAGGWLFVGTKAIEMKMADQVATLDQAIGDMIHEFNLEDPDVIDLPGPKGLSEIVEGMMGASSPGIGAWAPRGGTGEIVALLREMAGPSAWPGVRDALTAIMQLRREPVLLALPRAIIVR